MDIEDYDEDDYMHLLDDDEEDEEDESIPNINLDPGQLKKPTSRFDFRTKLEPHKDAGFKTMKKFEMMMYKNVLKKLNDNQKQILKDTIVYGLNGVECAGAKDNQHYVSALSDVVGDIHGEIVIMKSIISGIFSKTGYYPYNPRQYKSKYMYKHLDEILKNKKEFNKFLSDIFDVWNENIEELEKDGEVISESVCYNKEKWKVDDLLKHFAGQTRRSAKDGNVYKLEDYFDNSKYTNNQEAFDDWLKATIVYEQFAQEKYEGELQNIEERLVNPDGVTDYDERKMDAIIDEDYLDFKRKQKTSSSENKLTKKRRRKFEKNRGKKKKTRKKKR